jgi:hypothetical protein
MYLAVPLIVDNLITTGSPVPLGMFIGCTCFAVSVMGGTYALLPPYERFADHILLHLIT